MYDVKLNRRMNFTYICIICNKKYAALFCLIWHPPFSVLLIAKVSSLSKRTLAAESEKSQLEQEMKEVRGKFDAMKCKLDELVISDVSKMTIEDHVNSMAALKEFVEFHQVYLPLTFIESCTKRLNLLCIVFAAIDEALHLFEGFSFRFLKSSFSEFSLNLQPSLLFRLVIIIVSKSMLELCPAISKKRGPLMRTNCQTRMLNYRQVLIFHYQDFGRQEQFPAILLKSFGFFKFLCFFLPWLSAGSRTRAR